MKTALFVFVLFLFAACTLVDRPLRFNLGIEAVQLDWNRALDSTSAVVLDNIMEGLTTYADSLVEGENAQLLRPMPALAASWSVLEDGRVYRFYLKKGVVWSDGVPLTAQQFVDSWERLLNPATGSANAYHLLELENAPAYASGQLKDFSRVGVKAVDEGTLEVRLRRPIPYFLHLVASASTFPIRKDLIEKWREKWVDPEHLVTLGPYRLAEWLQGEQLLLEANPRYYGPSPQISKVICRLVSEPLAALALYQNGELDILPRDLPPSYAKELRQMPEYRSGPKLAMSFLLFNVHRAPFDKAENRRAFVEALDRSVLTSFFEGTLAASSSWIPPGLVGHDPAQGIQAVGRQSDLLKGQTITARFNGSDTWSLVFNSIQRTALDRLGLKMKLEPTEARDFGKYLAELSSNKASPSAKIPHLISLGWVADFPDAHNFMNLFVSGAENNYMRWRSLDYDALVEKAVATADEGARKRYYHEAQRLLLEQDVAIMPLFLSNHQALVRKELAGVELNVLDKWYFRKLRFDDGWRGLPRRIWSHLVGGPAKGNF
jgi:oligopeptide transport system substrate-binding protein